MICPNQSNRGPLEEEEEKEKENKCGSLPTADIVGAVGKRAKQVRIKFPVDLDANHVFSDF